MWQYEKYIFENVLLSTNGLTVCVTGGWGETGWRTGNYHRSGTSPKNAQSARPSGACCVRHTHRTQDSKFEENHYCIEANSSLWFTRPAYRLNRDPSPKINRLLITLPYQLWYCRHL